MGDQNLIKKKYVAFSRQPALETGKTQYWSLRHLTGEYDIGTIKWKASYHKYSFVPTLTRETIFDYNALREIANFCEELTFEHGGNTQAERA
jgi:hypothetical protein